MKSCCSFYQEQLLCNTDAPFLGVDGNLLPSKLALWVPLGILHGFFFVCNWHRRGRDLHFWVTFPGVVLPSVAYHTLADSDGDGCLREKQRVTVCNTWQKRFWWYSFHGLKERAQGLRKKKTNTVFKGLHVVLSEQSAPQYSSPPCWRPTAGVAFCQYSFGHVTVESHEESTPTGG